MPERVGQGRIGVCSWSLAGVAPMDLPRVVRDELGLSAVQLGLGPLLDGRIEPREVAAAFESCGVTVVSGMLEPIGEDYSSLDSIRRTGGFAPDVTWEANLSRARDQASLAGALGLGLVTTHAGAFVRADGSLDERVIDRLRVVVGVFGERGVRVGFETGQEDAGSTVRMLELLADPSAGLNFDPANVVLYGNGDPIMALDRMLPFVLQCHVKDADPPMAEGEWGSEVIVGTGSVDWGAFFAKLEAVRGGVDLILEREADDDGLGDISRGIDVVDRHCSWCRR